MFNILYKWHHRIGLLVTIPVIAWCISGLTHPIMAHFFKIVPANKKLVHKELELDSNHIDLSDALTIHGIDSFSNFRLVTFRGNSYYQIIKEGEDSKYINTITNQILSEGEDEYAEYLARHFLGDSIHSIKSITKVNRFNFEYKFINRLLPVYKVSFDRSDKMDVYVHNNSSRLGTLNNSNRKTSIAIFSYLHNWSFLNGMPNVKFILMIIFMGLGFFVAMSGLVIYGFMWKSLKGDNVSKSNSNRKWHRRIGLMVSLSTLGFTFSGGYHAFAKQNKSKVAKSETSLFAKEIIKNFPAFINEIGEGAAKNISLVRIGQQSFYQVFWLDKKRTNSYFDTSSFAELVDGEKEYAIDLATKYTGLNQDQIIRVQPIYKFGGEYGFINKRLPVLKVEYNTSQKHNVYVETASGKMATVISKRKRLEAFSFLMLHKYHFLDPLSKMVRDIVIVLLVLGIMLVNILGVFLWWKKRK